MDYVSPRRLNYFLGKVKNYIAQKLNLKQDVISDLSEIRSNAQSGASAYHKPNTGIPKTDLSTDVQTSLGKADTALQEHQDISGKQDLLVSGTNIKSIGGVSLLGNGTLYPTGTALVMQQFGLQAKGTVYSKTMILQYSESQVIGTSNGTTNTNKELTSLDFDPFGIIAIYLGSTRNEGGIITGEYTTLYGQRDLNTCFNIGSNMLSQYRSVYLKCEPLVDASNNRTGRVRLATGQPIVQALPTAEDGFVYILLGSTPYFNHQIFLYPHHPVYEFKDGALRIWTNQEEHKTIFRQW